VHTGDIDGDGDMDVLTPLDNGAVTWFENVGGGSSWLPNHIAGSASPADAMVAGDLDRDGDLDVVVLWWDGKINWWENLGGGFFGPFTTVSADGGGDKLHLADLDRNGALDILTADLSEDTVTWWSNDGNGGFTAETPITTSADQAESVFTADLDQDGDLDVLTASFADDTIAWYENDGAGNFGGPQVVTDLADGAEAVFASDLDGDGDPDVLSASLWSIDWHRNHAGHFAAVTTDTAPASIPAGGMDDVLKFVATHGGRPGDTPVELTSVELLLEQAPGNPLSVSEADALIDEIMVYRDADGDGAFDPRADLHLGTAASILPYSDGIQRVLIPDAEPAAQIAYDAPATLFVVVRLQPDAGNPSPHTFCVTHLTESSSRGEDSVTNEQLKLAYAANTTSGVVTADPSANQIGLHRKRNFFIDLNGNGSWDKQAGGDMVYAFGSNGDLPLVGDWNGDGYDEIGSYNPTKLNFYLDYNGSGTWDGRAGGDLLYRLGGKTTDLPIVGDWNGDGMDEIGVFRNRNFLIDYNANGHWDKQAGGDQVFAFGAFGDLPIIGDWNGDGGDDIGSYRPSNHKFYLDVNGSRWWDTGDSGFLFRNLLETPISGDWNHDGVDEIGTWNSGNLNFYLDYTGDGRWNGTVGGDWLQRMGGRSTDTPITGNWGPLAAFQETAAAFQGAVVHVSSESSDAAALLTTTEPRRLAHDRRVKFVRPQTELDVMLPTSESTEVVQEQQAEERGGKEEPAISFHSLEGRRFASLVDAVLAEF
jgi:hypothetical protein